MVERERGYHLYYANKDSWLFIDLMRMYWHAKIENSGLLEALSRDLVLPVVYLFGSCATAQVTAKSDVDIAMFSDSAHSFKKKYGKYEKIFKRKIDFFVFSSKADIKNPNLLNNIVAGYLMLGEWYGLDKLSKEKNSNSRKERSEFNNSDCIEF